jgi:hypothetical protein
MRRHRVWVHGRWRSVAGWAGRLRLVGVVSGYAAIARVSLVAYTGEKSLEIVRFARGSVRRALPGMLRLVPGCWHARVLRLGKHTSIWSEDGSTPVPSVKRQGIGVVLYTSSGLHSPTEYVREGGALAFDVLPATTSEESDEKE